MALSTTPRVVYAALNFEACSRSQSAPRGSPGLLMSGDQAVELLDKDRFVGNLAGNE